MISGSDPVAAARDNARNEDNLAQESARIAEARRHYDMTTRNLSGQTIMAIEHGTITDAECDASPVVKAARSAWHSYLELTRGAIPGSGIVHAPC